MRSVGYDGRSRILEIEFQSGEVYQYLDVPGTVHQKLQSAKSKGQYFNSEIRDELSVRAISKRPESSQRMRQAASAGIG